VYLLHALSRGDIGSNPRLPHHTQTCFGRERIGADKQEEQLSISDTPHHFYYLCPMKSVVFYFLQTIFDYLFY
jgi:hypothetical protein